MVSEVQRRVVACKSVMEPIFDAVQAISDQCELELQQLAEAEWSNAKKEDAMKERYLRIGVSAS